MFFAFVNVEIEFVMNSIDLLSDISNSSCGDTLLVCFDCSVLISISKPL